MGLLKEFRAFAIKGNAVDMAVGIVIGAAFGTLVNSLVDNVIMPPLGALIGDVDFAGLYINLSGGTYESLAAAQAAGAATINYGLFINSVLAFLIVAWALFIVVKGMNRLRSSGEEAPVTTKACTFCRSSIHPDATRCPHCTADLR